MSDLPLPPAFRQLGHSGIAVSPIAWGMWRLAENGRTPADAAKLVHAALDAGINFLDTADIYGFDGSAGFGDAEALLGEVLAAEPALRERMILATKGGILPPLPYDQSADYLRKAIDDSLARLKVDVIDLWQIHRPDILAHPYEVARVLDDAVSSGKVRALGVSNFTKDQIAALNHFLGEKLATTQPEISPLRIDCFENGELDQAMMLGLTPMAWSPLGGGRLASPQTARDKAVADALDAVAQAQGVSRTVAAYSWLMAHPAGIVPIIGSQQAARIAEGAEALKVRWNRQDWYAVLVAARGERLP
ncbi:aldo/keto reductase [Novosphingobium aromaticivorans DSM 12444]|uniref:6-dehydroglucose reductase n=1 Tax=Novosphingobium aromaticivorans (strain ATCC 700278 / DSM 12444 / CCUG 56034 / CIP 105152 / NBRC 16084 / F199) TaxID=279238 RepID=DHGRD_NOVAD|nr:aldo/keto reductase [Novosphingobium aromaticivorans]Q2G5J3.1 RecName: Full=6-dehydroglucose reductase; AltName: Full=NAD(P)-dependent D-glucose 6-dehydrogenase [Novosphingobium aromaticivorans DSM 12444]ABD26880.1 aldo/keto reductase [Novosphingobium aromaticivorans DSM 12444]SCY44436.1 Predicted oxidoreductase [Novosphingobium aromaticivorans]